MPSLSNMFDKPTSHYQSLTVKQGEKYENTLLQGGTVIDLPIGVPDLSVYDEVAGNE